ncbi:SlyX family protein [Hydrogenophaga sp. 5NK40-0174]|uniref:SlyX family protein n=1 Tax=Hydrogenophaga sp. 5NK40-0174 TaxID=3127649 RepID=UPI00310A07B9
MNNDRDDRVTQLEIKLSYAEDLLETLNDLVARQQDQIDWLTREVQSLRQRKDDEGQAVFRSLRDDTPPHY